MSDNAKRDLKNVMVMALRDGQISPEEKRFIEETQRRLGISSEEFEQLVAEVRSDPKRLEIPQGPEATNALQLLIDAAAVDGEISPKEQQIIHKVAQFAGIDDYHLDRLMPGGQVSQEQQDAIDAAVEEIYLNFAQWDDATRQAKLQVISANGHAAVVPLLEMLESYRTPDNADNSLDLKTIIADQLGTLGDSRAIYYLAQQISLGEINDEVTSHTLQEACAYAIGNIIKQPFEKSPKGIADGRMWWQNKGQKEFSNLAI